MTDKAIIESYLVRLEKLGAVRAKPMFGEWGVYLNESFAAIIGEDQRQCRPLRHPVATLRCCPRGLPKRLGR